MVAPLNPVNTAIAPRSSTGRTICSAFLRVSGMIGGGKSKDDIKAMLISDFGWQATGIGMNSLDGVIAELKK